MLGSDGAAHSSWGGRRWGQTALKLREIPRCAAQRQTCFAAGERRMLFLVRQRSLLWRWWLGGRLSRHPSPLATALRSVRLACFQGLGGFSHTATLQPPSCRARVRKGGAGLPAEEVWVGKGSH